MSYLNGPTYEKFQKELINSQRNWMQPADRKELNGTTGVNQRGIICLEKDTFLTLRDALELGNYSIHEDKIKAELDKMLARMSLIEKAADNLTGNEAIPDFEKATNFIKRDRIIYTKLEKL